MCVSNSIGWDLYYLVNLRDNVLAKVDMSAEFELDMQVGTFIIVKLFQCAKHQMN